MAELLLFINSCAITGHTDCLKRLLQAFIGADSIGQTGAIAPTAEKLWGRCLQSPNPTHGNVVMPSFETVK